MGNRDNVGVSVHKWTRLDLTSQDKWPLTLLESTWYLRIPCASSHTDSHAFLLGLVVHSASVRGKWGSWLEYAPEREFVKLYFQNETSIGNNSDHNSL